MRRGRPSPAEPASEDGLTESLLFGLIRLGWAYRVELALVGLPLVGWRWMAAQLGRAAATAALCALLVTVVLVPVTRRWVWRCLAASHLRRAWERAHRLAPIVAFKGQVPLILKQRRVPAGQALEVKVPPGGAVSDLEVAAERLAAVLGAREVRVRRDPASAARARVTIVRRDPLAEGAVLAWPRLEVESMSLWEPVPVGVDEEGEVVSVALAERNVLFSGEPGSGKSAAMGTLVAAAALDPSVKLYLLDGKQVELATWAGVATWSVGPDVQRATALLRGLLAEMDLRYAQLLARRHRKVGRQDGMGLQVVVCDELALYLAGPDRKARTEFAEALRDLVARGRAAGIIVLAATQKPSSDIVPTSLRDLFGFRWALRCTTREASDTILGSGWASLGYSAADIDPTARGVGYLLHEGGLPVRLRSFYLSDDQLQTLAERAEHVRSTAQVPGSDAEIRGDARPEGEA
ncbi:MAG: FtsK/SpoIIIE domain-containing protein [Acidimicrobiales bacterium]